MEGDEKGCVKWKVMNTQVCKMEGDEHSSV